MNHLLRTACGRPYPLGATVHPEGVHFVIFTKNATAVELLLFDRFDAPEPSHVIPLDPSVNRTFYYWHVFVHDLKPGQIYAYRVDGPYDPARGHRFDPSKVLLDPYAREIIYGINWSRDAARAERLTDDCATAMKCVVVDPDEYDWEGDTPLHCPFNEAVIYEMHVGGFTKHPSSGVAHRGTYHGLIQKIPYLQDLGITAVELLPVQQFDEQDITDRCSRPPTPRRERGERERGICDFAVPTPHLKKGQGCSNYWGYNPVGFFAPHRGYCTSLEHGKPVTEFRDMVKALHRAGIEVILDVVFNHTAEGDHLGPTISFRGLENCAYYLLDEDHSLYSDYTGTGNTVNGNHSIVRRLILDALHYWVEEMHVDGFRFDLASVLSRDEWGQPMRSPPILWDIESDPRLVGTKIIAEAWDAAGLYQVGTFIGHRWAEWNGRYRDDVRRFLRGDNGTVVDFIARVTGSRDIYTKPEHALHRSINFVTSHDGFTLNDLVSYDRKHNEANGENNRDGADQNYSYNYGYEGPTDDPEIQAVRLRQIKNTIATLMVSQGTPMLLFGDEARRTQDGNNNAYCQDNEISWLNWEDINKQQELVRFVQLVVRFNREHPILNLEIYPADRSEAIERSQAARRGVETAKPQIPHSRSCCASSRRGCASFASASRSEAEWARRGIGRREPRLWEDTERIAYHGVKLNQPDWGYYSHSIALTLRAEPRLASWLRSTASLRGADAARGERPQVKTLNERGPRDDDMHIMFNAYWEALEFELPVREPSQGPWLCAVDTARPSPHDIAEPGQEQPLTNTRTYLVSARSVVILIACVAPS